MNAIISALSPFSETLIAITHNFGNLHPAAVHFPFALGSTAFLFIIGALFICEPKKSLLLQLGLLILLLSLFFIFLSVKSGELAAEQLPLLDEPQQEALIKHMDLATASLKFFLIESILLGSYILTRLLTRNKLIIFAQQIILPIIIFIHVLGLLILANAAHSGGKLVHQHGLLSELYKFQQPLK